MRLNKLIFVVLTIGLSTQAWADSFPFEKEAPVAKIHELLGKSREDKIRLIEASGIVVRQVEFKNPDMLGQYLDLAHYPGLKAPEIRLAARADDWTIVHEFTHALFAAHAKHHHPLMSVTEYESAQSEFQESWATYASSWRYQSAEHQERVLKAFVTVARYQLEQLSNFELEEMAIESYLNQLYLKQKPADFTPQAFELSQKYLKFSGLKALIALKDLNVSCSNVMASYSRERLSTPASVAGLCTLSRIYHSQVQEILKDANIRVYEPIGDK